MLYVLSQTYRGSYNANVRGQIFDQGNNRFGAVVREDPTQDPSV